MAAYHCKHCGLGANSKCASSRNVFTEDRYETILGMVLKRHVTRDEREIKVALNYRMIVDSADKVSDAQAIENVLMTIKELPDEVIKHYACDHVWVLDSDECELGCCHKIPT